jgi:hypothetical protein
MIVSIISSLILAVLTVVFIFVLGGFALIQSGEF